MMTGLTDSDTGRAWAILGAALLMWTSLMIGGPLASPADAHASLVASSPGNGQLVGGLLVQIDLVFNETVDAPRVTVSGPGGAMVEASVSQPSPNHLKISLVSPLEEEGEYRVDYQLISADEDPLSLTLDFAYEQGADPALPVVAAVISKAGSTDYAWIVVGGLAIVVVALGLRFVRSRQALRQYS